jgi:hypothetical protein
MHAARRPPRARNSIAAPRGRGIAVVTMPSMAARPASSVRARIFVGAESECQIGRLIWAAVRRAQRRRPAGYAPLASRLRAAVVALFLRVPRLP